MSEKPDAALAALQPAPEAMEAWREMREAIIGTILTPEFSHTDMNDGTAWAQMDAKVAAIIQSYGDARVRDAMARRQAMDELLATDADLI